MQRRIDNFIRGKMTPQQEQQFIADCKSNPVLREKAIMTAYLVKGLQMIHNKYKLLTIS